MSETLSPPGQALAASVRARRIQLGLRQSELADLAGCSARFVSALEGGKGAVQLDKVLDVLGVLGLDLVLAPGHGNLVDGDGTAQVGERRRIGRPRS